MFSAICLFNFFRLLFPFTSLLFDFFYLDKCLLDRLVLSVDWQLCYFNLLTYFFSFSFSTSLLFSCSSSCIIFNLAGSLLLHYYLSEWLSLFYLLLSNSVINLGQKVLLRTEVRLFLGDYGRWVWLLERDLTNLFYFVIVLLRSVDDLFSIII